MKKGQTKNNQSNKITSFADLVWSYYHAHKRGMPWRVDTSLYNVIVSEIMLQQTQVSRVLPKFETFTKRFPDWEALAQAPTADVLKKWSGLGYNRRALYLKRIAEKLTAEKLAPQKIGPLTLEPLTYDELRELPGIGPNTAGAVMAFAYNVPRPFIETNIRSAFIYFFFGENKTPKKLGRKISDDKLTPLIEQALALPRNRRNPREWHWALMDYGSDLKARLPNPSRRSAHHVRQKPFKGSNRELRSLILKRFMDKPRTAGEIEDIFKPAYPVSQIADNIADLVAEGFITHAPQGMRRAADGAGNLLKIV